MKSNYTIDSQFLIKILKDEANETEKELFNQWLQENDENKEEFGRIALLWEKTGKLPAPLSPDLVSEWLKLERKIEDYRLQKLIQPINKISKNLNHVFSSNKLLKTERSRGYVEITRMAVIILLSLVALQLLRNPVKKELTQETAEIKIYEFQTKKGEKATIPLADGSFVYLNADSRFSYPQFFNGNKRLVRLEGEGYFIVKSDPNNPFIVQTGDKFTEVKGTEFNLKYRNDKLSLVVTRGKVVLYSRDSSKFVNVEKDELIIARENNFTRPIKVDTRLYTAWRENKISFVETPLSEIVDELERFYNVDISVRNRKILTKTLTGYFDSNSLDEILEKISLALDFNYQRNGKRIIIY